LAALTSFLRTILRRSGRALAAGEHRSGRCGLVGAVALAAALVPSLPPVATDVAAQTRTDLVTDVGLLGLTVTNLGYVGDAFDSQYQPSGEYPLTSNVEHLYLGGLWVGAVNADGDIHVSTGAQDAAALQDGDEIREFRNPPGAPVYEWSNNHNSNRYPYDPRALATQHIEVIFDDYADIPSGNHEPLGLKVILRALAWSNSYADDYVILDYTIINVSDEELRDVYVGFWNDTTVGNTEHTDPYDPDAPLGWNFYDDKNGAWGPAAWVPPEYVPEDENDVWMMYERDDDGDEGLATSWVGCRLLGTVPEVQELTDRAPVSYNAWRFQNVPARDDTYVDEDTQTIHPGKYQLMSNGAFTVGQYEGQNYDAASDWVALLSTGPFPSLAADDTLRVSFALCCGPDSLGLLENSGVAQVAYDANFSVPSGPPSPRLEVAQEQDSIILRWAPGDSTDAEGEPLPSDSPLRSPEHHISNTTGAPDFQGYRVYRFQGRVLYRNPYELADLVAQYDIVDGRGFDTGLPPLDADGQRVVVDTNLLDGFPYWYAVTSYSAPNLEAGLPEFESGFNENSVLVYPGPAAEDASAAGWEVGVYPNPYRAGSYFDNPQSARELGRRIWFTGLTPRCRIEIYTLAGELARTIEHDDPSSGQHAWDLLTDHQRAIATGLYIYVVTDHATGEQRRGKLVIIK
jgi:hypothetical protein